MLISVASSEFCSVCFFICSKKYSAILKGQISWGTFFNRKQFVFFRIAIQILVITYFKNAQNTFNSKYLKFKLSVIALLDFHNRKLYQNFRVVHFQGILIGKVLLMILNVVLLVVRNIYFFIQKFCMPQVWLYLDITSLNMSFNPTQNITLHAQSMIFISQISFSCCTAKHLEERIPV